MKKVLSFILVMAMVMTIVVGCSTPDTATDTSGETSSSSGGAAISSSGSQVDTYEENVYVGSEEDLGSADPYGNTTSATQYFTNITHDTLIKK